MADLTFDQTATVRKDAIAAVAGKGNANAVQTLVSCTIELATTASGQTIKLGRIPSNARLLPMCGIYNDDLATSGAPTLDIGLASVDSNITSDPDAINAGIVLNAATNTVQLYADAANSGLPVWDLVNGQSTDPKGLLDVYATIKDATTNAAGTLSVTILGYLD
tara:strand:+ start:6743 stop:7234 length:492 start_codon:yes stop_codon:yes gene_type:complete